ncbi:MAG: DUF4401 domain-containing protein [Sphingobacteriales bacterium]|nr:MAG: DUF4401 domain-containing protein [Sphingobacteriales bacterium]
MNRNNPGIDRLLETIFNKAGDVFTVDHSGIAAEIDRNPQAYSNIFIKILSAIGGFLATLALLGFLLLAGLYNSEPTMVVLGALMSAAAVFTSRLANHVFLDTAVLTVYVAGLCLAGFGIAEVADNGDAAIGCCLLLSVAGILFSRGFMMTMVSVLVANGCLIAYCSGHAVVSILPSLPLVFSGFALLVITLKESWIITRSVWLNKLFRPLQTGFFISFLCGLAWVLHGDVFGIYAGIADIRLLSVAGDVLVLIMVYKIVTAQQVVNTVYVAAIYAFTLLILAAVFFAPGISGSLFLLLLSVYYGYKAEVAVSIAALGYFIVKFYYSLQMNLLVKSGLLIAPGVLLILLWFFFQKQLKEHEEI